MQSIDFAIEYASDATGNCASAHTTHSISPGDPCTCCAQNVFAFDTPCLKKLLPASKAQHGHITTA